MINVYSINEEQQNIITGRYHFVNKYCNDMGWDKNDLSFEQIMEIRKQDEWKQSITTKGI